MKKKLFSALCTVLLFFSFSIPSYATPDISVLVDNSPVYFDVQPQLIGGRTMVPLRGIFEALGASVEWDESSRKITAYNEISLVTCAIGSNDMYVNNTKMTIDVPPMIVNGRTLVPARFIAEAFNCDVTWGPDIFTIFITSSPIDYSSIEGGNNSLPKNSASSGSMYYPNSSIPDYTHVTGIKELSHESDDNCVLYTYDLTMQGDQYDMVKYIGYLLNNGWEEFDSEDDDTSLSVYLVKDCKLIGITADIQFNRVILIIPK